jgi:hypothetical protein
MDQTVQTKAGPLIMHVFGTETGKISYAVMYGDYKVQVKPKKGLDGVRDGEVAPGSSGGSPSKRIIVEMADGNTLVSQFFLVRTKLYRSRAVHEVVPVGEVDSRLPLMVCPVPGSVDLLARSDRSCRAV